jgi:hypothetical protein
MNVGAKLLVHESEWHHRATTDEDRRRIQRHRTSVNPGLASADLQAELPSVPRDEYLAASGTPFDGLGSYFLQHTPQRDIDPSMTLDRLLIGELDLLVIQHYARRRGSHTACACRGGRYRQRCRDPRAQHDFKP